MAIYGKLTQAEALAISYWDAVNSWGIDPSSYPQSYYPDSVCGCRIPVVPPVIIYWDTDSDIWDADKVVGQVYWDS